ncbi:MAG: metallophosphoesterase family protein [Chthoniobacteraceae bacterium]
MKIGVISDTHGLLRAEAMEFLRSCDHIIHAGDVGSAAILETLAALKPLTVVRGNVDHGEWAEALPETALVKLGGRRILVLHDVAALGSSPSAAGIAVVVFGHSHQPTIREEDGVVYLNPGSAGPRRFKLPICVAEMVITKGVLEARIVELGRS